MVMSGKSDARPLGALKLQRIGQHVHMQHIWILDIEAAPHACKSAAFRSLLCAAPSFALVCCSHRVDRSLGQALRVMSGLCAQGWERVRAVFSRNIASRSDPLRHVISNAADSPSLTRNVAQVRSRCVSVHLSPWPLRSRYCRRQLQQRHCQRRQV